MARPRVRASKAQRKKRKRKRDRLKPIKQAWRIFLKKGVNAVNIDHEFPGEWEYDFRIPPRIAPPKDHTIPTEECQSDAERFGLTTCAECNDLIHQDEAVVKVYYNGDQQQTEHFCSDDCKVVWYINHLRRAL